MARRLVVLQDLTEAGMEIVAALRVEAQALSRGEAEPGAPGARGSSDLALTFSRVARAVRQTLALEARFVREHLTGELRSRTAGPKASPQARMEAERESNLDTIRSVVVEAIEAEGFEPEETERLFNDARERLQDNEDELADRPVGAIIAEICGALGFQPDWDLWAEESWALKEAHFEASGSPYAADFEPPDLARPVRRPAASLEPGVHSATGPP
jgi:hypothetical protein